jgi:beta-phosphoglucomutase
VIKAIVFDAEGVIIDTESIWDEEQTIFLSKRKILYERHNVKHLLSGRSLKESTQILVDFYGIKSDAEKLVYDREKIFQSLLPEKVSFVDGFKDFFDKVAPHFKVCVATSLARNSLSLIDKKLDLHGLFQGNIFCVDDIGGKSKPDPAIFHYAAEKLEINASECLVIEDSPNGIEAANKAGMKCIGLSTTYSMDKIKNADFVYENYREIPLSKLKFL